MVFYLGFNFLDQAVAAKRNFLEKCLITVPQHLDHVEIYIHKGHLPDEKYRFPWKRAKADDQFLIQESTNNITDTCALANEELWKKPGCEPFYSQRNQINISSLTEAVTFDLVCDVIPSSNQSSNDLFSPDDFFLEKSLFQETFEREDLNKFSSACDSLKVECTEDADEGLSKTLKSIPDLPKLASRVKAVQVKDPFLLENGQPTSEHSFFRDEKLYSTEKTTCMLEQTFDSTLVSEKYMKTDAIPPASKELEDIAVMDPRFFDANTVTLIKEELMRSVTVPKTLIVLEDEPAVSSVVSKDIVKPGQMHYKCIEKLKYPSESSTLPLFLDINEIVVTEHERFCERAKLDPPVVEDSSIDQLLHLKLSLPARTVIDATHSKTWLLDEKEKQTLTQRVWLMNKYCDEIQASRLTEPELQENTKEKEVAFKQVLQLMKVEKDTTIGKTELELNWSVIKLADEPVDPCKSLVALGNVKSSYSWLQQIKEVEEFKKYGVSDLSVSTDEELLLENESYKNEKPAADAVLMKRIHTKPGPIQTEGSSSNCCSDPLCDFMALRSKKTSIKPQEIDVRKEYQMTDKQVIERKIEMKSNMISKKKVKHHVVEIKISENYHQVLSILEKASDGCLHVLKQKEEVSSNSSFKSLTPETSRFLLKQREKYLLDHKIEGVQDEVYKMTLLLHGLVIASEITIHCSLESAIGYLRAFQEKYKNVIGGSLDGLRQHLFQMRTEFHEQRIQHPKVMTLCKEVETWLKKKRMKSRDSEQKILILVKRELPSLLQCLNDALALGSILSPCILSSAEPENIIQSLDKHNCVITCSKTVTENFPWAQFSLVVEYENDASSPWQQLCERQNIRHIGLNIGLEEKHGLRDDSLDWTPKYPDQQICLIGSGKVTNNTELLQLLESRHNILLIERDYSLLGHAKHLYFSDLDVDVNTAVVIEEMNAVMDDCVIQNAVTKMVALSLKYTKCWIILFSQKKNGSCSFPGHVVSNLSRLQAAVSNFTQKSEQFIAKVLYSEGNSELSRLIRSISEESKNLLIGKTSSSLCDGNWLTNEITQEEKFLLMLPCLNSMSAQLLMKQVSLKGIFSKSLEDISEAVPDISFKTLKMLKYLVQSNTGLHLREHADEKPEFEHKGEACKDYSCMEAESKLSETNEKYELEKESYVPQNLEMTENDGKIVDVQINCLQNEPKKNCNRHQISSDLYVPEDFQQSNKYDTMKDDTMSSSSHTISNRMNSFNDSGVNLNNKYSKRHIDVIQKNNNLQDFSNIGDVNKNEHFGKGTLPNKMLLKEEAKKNKCSGWESLDQYISENEAIDRCETQPSTERETLFARKLSPVEKLQFMRQQEQQMKHTVLYDRGLKYDVKGSSCIDQASMFDSRVAYKQNVLKNSFDEQHRVYREYNVGSECLKQNFNNQDVSKQSFNNQDVSRHAKTHQNGYHENDLPKRCLTLGWKPNVLQKETFEYNHGLPYRCSNIINEAVDLDAGKSTEHFENHLLTTRIEHDPNNRKCHENAPNFVSTNQRINLEKEFPPAEEIDRSVTEESMGKEMRKELVSEQYYNNNENFAKLSKSDSFSSNTILNDPYDHNDLYKKEDERAEYDVNMSRQIRSVKENSSLSNMQTSCYKNSFDKANSSKEFNFNPQLIEYDNEISKPMSHYQIVGQDLYLNPKLDRISVKIDADENKLKRTASTDAVQTRSLEDDLRETTKKLLENSRQFSRFDANLHRRPLKKVSIGLAQPQLRNKSRDIKDDLYISEEGQILMAQSPWATDDSPPMDLEYDNAILRRSIQNETANRITCTSQTPSKRRKLTYQTIPGRKGQTQLVFK